MIQRILSSDSGSEAAEKINDNFSEIAGFSAANTLSLRVLHWNQGCFNLGESPDGRSLSEEEYLADRRKWLSKFQRFSPDIICACESLENFASVGGVAHKTADELFGDFVSVVRGGSSYNSKHIASNYVGMTGEFRVFDYHADAFTNASAMVATIPFNGISIKVIEAHLDWKNINFTPSGSDTQISYRQWQIEDLISLCEDEDYVIMCGDFNVDAATEYDVFKTAGFTMANHGDWGDLKTYHSTDSENTPSKPIDNIIVKGFKINNVQVIDDSTLTDHCGLVCDLEFTQE